MQEITFTIKVPDGFTKEEVLDLITGPMSGFIGDHERPGLDCSPERQILEALHKVSTEPEIPSVEAAKSELNGIDLIYMRKLPHNDFQQGWLERGRVRSKLEQLKLVTTRFDEVSKYRHGVNATLCELTDFGREVLASLEEGKAA